MLAVLLLLLQSSSDPHPVYDGRLHQVEVQIPRIEAPAVHIDGVLDEATWQQAALLTGFTQYRPVDSRPAEDSTDVFAFYGPDAIYFGIRAYEAHGSVVRATLADRDNIDADDKIQILLDTFNDRRRALLFAVNPLGVQQDGLRSEGLAGAAESATSYGYQNIDPELGVNVRWGVTQNLSAAGTVNPDFSQVEADVGQVTVNQRFALFFPEKRPFFLEGLEQFDTPNALIYTRQINSPIVGAKLTGKIGPLAVAYIGAIDDDGGGLSSRSPIFNLLRLRRDLGANSTLGIAYTD